jgi:hypothetical protein
MTACGKLTPFYWVQELAPLFYLRPPFFIGAAPFRPKPIFFAKADRTLA